MPIVPIEFVVGLIQNILTSSNPGDVWRKIKNPREVNKFFVDTFVDRLKEQDKTYYKKLIKKISRQKSIFLGVLLDTLEELSCEFSDSKEHGPIFSIILSNEFNSRFIGNLLNHKDVNIPVSESRLKAIMPLYIKSIITKLDTQKAKIMVNHLLEKDPRDMKWSLSAIWQTEILKNLKQLQYKAKEIATKLDELTQIMNTSFTWDEFRDACKNQTVSYMGPLKRKYDPDLYVAREYLESEFEEFLNSNANLLTIIAEAGFGKTNLLCNLVENSEYPSLFYSGEFYKASDFLVEDEIERFLLTELGGRSKFREIIALSIQKEGGADLVDKISKINDKKVLIFIDALNEFKNPPGVLESLTKTIIEFGSRYPHLKFILSCRQSSWQFILDKQEILLPKSRLYTPDKVTILNRGSFQETIGIQIKEFDDEEVTLAFYKYKEKYELEGFMSRSAEKKCKNPFMLRIISEAYKGRSVPGNVENINVLDKYWQEKVEKGIPEKELLILNTALNMWEQKENELNLHFLINQPYFRRQAFEELKDEGILIEYQDNYEKRIKFNYERFFEYTLARYLYNERSKIINKSRAFIEEMGYYVSLTGFLEFFIPMLEINFQKKILLSLLEGDYRYHEFVCYIISELDTASEEIYSILYKISGNIPYYEGVIYNKIFSNLKRCIVNISEKNPKIGIEILKNVISNVTKRNFPFASDHYPAIETIIRAAPKLIKEVKHWLKNKNWMLQAVAVHAIINHYEMLKDTEIISVIEKFKSHSKSEIRSDIAESVKILPDVYDEFTIKLLKEFAGDEDEFVRKAAAHTLGEKFFFKPEYIDIFYNWANSSNWKIKQSSAYCAYFAYNSQPERGWEAIRNLSHEGNPEIIKAIVDSLLSYMLIASENIYRDPIVDQIPVKALSLLEKIIVNSNNDLINYLIFKGIPIILDDKTSEEYIGKWSSNPNWKLRVLFVLIFGHFFYEDDRIVKLLKKAAEDKSEYVRMAVAKTVGFRAGKYEEQLEIAEILFEDKNWEVRSEMMKSFENLYKIKPQRCLEILKIYLTEKSCRHERFQLGVSLKDFPIENSEVFETLKQWIKEGDYKICETFVPPLAALIKNRINVDECLSLLEQIQKSEEPFVRWISTLYIGSVLNIKSGEKLVKKCLAFLERSAKDRNFIIRRQAFKYLIAILSKIKICREKILDIIGEALDDEDWSVRYLVPEFMILGIGYSESCMLIECPKESLRILKKSMDASDWIVRASAAFPSTFINSNEGDNLISKLKEDKNSRVRKLVTNILNSDSEDIDKILNEFQIQVYCRDLKKFYQEIEYTIDISLDYKKTFTKLNSIKKCDEDGMREILSKLKNSDSQYLQDIYLEMTDGDGAN